MDTYISKKSRIIKKFFVSVYSIYMVSTSCLFGVYVLHLVLFFGCVEWKCTVAAELRVHCTVGLGLTS